MKRRSARRKRPSSRARGSSRTSPPPRHSRRSRSRRSSKPPSRAVGSDSPHTWYVPSLLLYPTITPPPRCGSLLLLHFCPCLQESQLKLMLGLGLGGGAQAAPTPSGQAAWNRAPANVPPKKSLLEIQEEEVRTPPAHPSTILPRSLGQPSAFPPQIKSPLVPDFAVVCLSLQARVRAAQSAARGGGVDWASRTAQNIPFQQVAARQAAVARAAPQPAPAMRQGQSQTQLAVLHALFSFVFGVSSISFTYVALTRAARILGLFSPTAVRRCWCCRRMGRAACSGSRPAPGRPAATGRHGLLGARWCHRRGRQAGAGPSPPAFPIQHAGQR